jgi:hypothetical protein
MIVIKDTSVTSIDAQTLRLVLVSMLAKPNFSVGLLSQWQDNFCQEYQLTPVLGTLISIAEPTDGHSDQALMFSVEAINTINNNISLLNGAIATTVSKLDDIVGEPSSVPTSPMMSPMAPTAPSMSLDEALRYWVNIGALNKITTMPTIFEIDTKTLGANELYKTQVCATGSSPTVASKDITYFNPDTINAPAVSSYEPLDQTSMQSLSSVSSMQMMTSSMWWIWLVIALIVVIILAIIIAVSQIKSKKTTTVK